ncbi:unnamed protein product [Heterobilharzia americana]|nr:unnamed protein product [Heterobilharzia americana]
MRVDHILSTSASGHFLDDLVEVFQLSWIQIMNTFGGNRKPQRSSLRLTVDPVDSASEGTGSLKSLNRRVSFSQYVFVLGEDDNSSQMCVSNRFTSDVSMEDDFHDGADNDEKEAGDVTLINDVSMEVAPYACVDIKHMSFNEDQTINMEMGDEGSQYDHADNVISSSKYNSLQSVCVSTDQTVVADSSVSDKTLQQDDSDMEVQITLCQLPTGSKSVNMSVTSGIELNHLPIDEKTDNNSNNKNLCRKQDIRDDSMLHLGKKSMEM